MLVLPRFTEKPHIVNKLTSMTPEQKQQVNQFFAQHKNLENQIDWNLGQKLNYQVFKNLMDKTYNSFNAKQKRVKKFGVEGLTEGMEYGRVETGNPDIVAVVPFNYEASQILAGNGVGGTCEGEWCIAYQHDDQYWKRYTGKGDTFMFVMVTHLKEKFAFQIPSSGRTDVWTPGDSRISIDEFVAIYNQSFDFSIVKQEVLKWCREAESLAEGHLERGPLYTEVDNSWSGWVDHLDPKVFEMAYYVHERSHYEHGDSEDSEAGFESKINMKVINKDSMPREMMDEAKEVGFDIISGHGLFFSLPENTNTPDEAQRKGYNTFNSDWGDLYDEDAVHELKKFLGLPTNWDQKESAQYVPDYLIFDTNALLSQLESDSLFIDLIERVVKFSIPHKEWNMVENDLFGFVCVNTHYHSEIGEGNLIDRVDRPDGPVWYDDPNQQELQFEARMRRLLNGFSHLGG